MKSSHSGRAWFSAEQRAAIISDYRSSGLTQKAFALRHGIKFTTFRNWLYGRRSVAAAATKPVALQEIELGRLLAPDPWAAEIALSGGAIVRLNGGADPEWASAIIQTLRQP
jgi:transposase-like protein